MELNIKQEQSLGINITQVMNQYLYILQMSAIDLKEAIEKEYNENPILDIEFSQYPDVFFQKNSSFSINQRDESPINLISKKVTLKEYLYEQLRFIKEDKNIILICKYVIENINSNGYLLCDADEIMANTSQTIESVERGIKIVQGFDPSGIGAKNLKECLVIQLASKNMLNSDLQKIIENCLELVSINNIKKISQTLNIPTKKVNEYMSIIRTLEPKPCRGFSFDDKNTYIIPEAEIKVIDSEICILINQAYLPKLTINDFYKNTYQSLENKEAKDYIEDKYNQANALITGIKKRNKTIFRILEEIVNIQIEFFLKGQFFLVPMTMKNVAKKLLLHESTISRAVKGKYVITPYGTMKMKEFFSSPAENFANNTHPFVLKKMLMQFLKQEQKSKPFSDQEICKLFKEKGIDISRRTIAKYRSELGIPSSNMRKSVMY